MSDCSSHCCYLLEMMSSPKNGWTDSEDGIQAAVMDDDSSVVLAGYTSDGTCMANTSTLLEPADFAPEKLDSDFNELWRRQDVRHYDDVLITAKIGDDGSVVMAGFAEGSRNATNAGVFRRVYLESERIGATGNLLKIMQGGTDDQVMFLAAAMGDDGSVVLAGYTEDAIGDESKEEGHAFADVELGTGGEQLGQWQYGTDHKDMFTVAAVARGDSVILAGQTHLHWNGSIAGKRCFAVVLLDADGDMLWKWQVGSTHIENSLRQIWPRPELAAVDWPDYAIHLCSGEKAFSKRADVDDAVESNVGYWRSLGYYLFATCTLDSAPAPTPYLRGSSSTLDWTSRPPPEIILRERDSLPWEVDPISYSEFSPSFLPTMEPRLSDVEPIEHSYSFSSRGFMICCLVTAAAVAVFVLAGAYLRRRVIGQIPNSTPVSTSEEVSSSLTAEIAGDSALPASVLHVSAPLPLGGGTGGDDQMGIGVVDTDGGDTGRTDSSHDQQRGPFPDVISTGALESRPPALSIAVAESSNKATTLPDGKDNTALAEGFVDKHADQRSLGVTVSSADTSTAGKPEPRAQGGLLRWADSIPTYPEHGVKNSDREANLEANVSNIPTVDAQPKDAQATTISREKGPARESSNDGSVAQAVVDAAKVLAHNTMVPGVSEAATLVSLVVKLGSDYRSNAAAVESRIRWCRSILAMLTRAGGVLGQNEEANGEAEQVLLEDVRESINDLVQLMLTYRSKNRMSKVVTSSLCRRRQEEAEAAIDVALSRLQLGLQVQVAQDVRDVKEGLLLQKRQDFEDLKAQELAESLTKARHARRQRRLDQIEIPADQLTVTDEVLGRGGFATVYLADYNGRNAAAKVQITDHDLAGMDDDDIHEEERMVHMVKREEEQHRAFMCELEAMIRLRNPHTVHVYGAITCRPGQFILVMELLPGGDLRTLLKKANKPLTEDHARRIVSDIGAGMAFLHSKSTVHGDMKSANVLFDGAGRAKIADFGSARWTQHTMSTGLVTYTARRGEQTRMSFPWAAPEVLSSGASSYSSDMYSFGMVVWEVLSRKIPWSGVHNISDIHRLVVLRGDRPYIPPDAPVDLARLCFACWVPKPEQRPTFEQVLADLNMTDCNNSSA